MENGENIEFHEEEVVTEAKRPVCKIALYAFISSIVYFVLLLVSTFVFKDNKTIQTVLSVIAFIAFVASIVLGIIGLKKAKKEALSGKGYALCGIILPFVFYIVAMIMFMAFTTQGADSFSLGFNCAQSSDCVDNGDDTSTCKNINTGKEINCPNYTLKQSQYK